MPDSGAGAVTRIVLQGGGRLERVAQVLDVRLEPDPLHCAADGPDRLLVTGAVRAYLYCRTSRGRDVEGQGVFIPFSTRIAVADAARAKVEIAELRSEYDYDPVTGDFQHQIYVDLSIHEPRAEFPEQAHWDGPAGDFPGRHEPPEEGPAEDAPVADTPFLGTPSANVLPVDAPPARVPSADALPVDAPPAHIARADALPADAPGETAGLEEIARAPAPSRSAGEPKKTPAAGEEEPHEREERRKGPIVWGPFPPPIA